MSPAHGLSLTLDKQMAIAIETTPTRKPETFPALNGLRFLAAIAVVFFHYAPEVTGYSHVPKLIRHLISEGPAAVGFFFILSGFVLAYRHIQRPLVETKASFYWARVLRLYPAYFIRGRESHDLAVRVVSSSPDLGFLRRSAFCGDSCPAIPENAAPGYRDVLSSRS